MRILPYDDQLKNQWDRFVLDSKNGTFLLLRDYMDYHKARFTDASLLILEDNEILAILPACRQEDVLISHQGLTYGGFITNQKMTQPLMLNIFKLILNYFLENGISSLIYKTIPNIYHRGPADEDKYALFFFDASLKRRDVLTVVDHTYSIDFQNRRKRTLKKAVQLNFNVKQITDYRKYWDILERNLNEKYATSPVHTVAEISMLAENFPNNIKLFGCYHKDELLAGIVVYETDLVAHFQYISANSQGKESGALDWLFKTLIQDIYKAKKYIDFGISNENDGRYLNQGLIDYKEGFGGRSFIHDHYQLNTAKGLAILNVQ